MSGWRGRMPVMLVGSPEMNLRFSWDRPRHRYFRRFRRLRRSGEAERERGRSEAYLVTICKKGRLDYTLPFEPRPVLAAQVLEHRRFTDRDAGMMARDRRQVDFDRVLHSTTQDVFSQIQRQPNGFS